MSLDWLGPTWGVLATPVPVPAPLVLVPPGWAVGSEVGEVGVVPPGLDGLVAVDAPGLAVVLVEVVFSGDWLGSDVLDWLVALGAAHR